MAIIMIIIIITIIVVIVIVSGNYSMLLQFYSLTSSLTTHSNSQTTKTKPNKDVGTTRNG